MSRIGRQPIPIPSGVTVTLADGAISAKGPKGELHLRVHPRVSATQRDGVLHVMAQNPGDGGDRALWGLSRVLIANMLEGVTKGFQKVLEVHGVGYRVAVQGKSIILNIGFSHPVEFALPVGIEAKTDGNVLTISGIDKQLVGETAARIRSYKKPEPYKGKGIRYAGEAIRRKAGKVMKGSTA